MEAAGNRVLVTRVQSIAGVERRARRLGEQIIRAFGDEPVHLIGHSMGGLDARCLLTDEAWRRRVLSITTIGTPHLGSTIADFAKLRVGRVYRMLEAMKIDGQGMLDVTRRSARRFHGRNPAPSGVPCFSIAGDPHPDDVCWPLKRLHGALFELEGPNDGLVSVESANAFGHPLPNWPIDHLRQMNWLAPGEPRSLQQHPLDLHASVLDNLASLGFGTQSRPPAASDLGVYATSPSHMSPAHSAR